MTMLRKSLFPGGGLVGEHSQAILGPQISGSDAELARLLDVGRIFGKFLDAYDSTSRFVVAYDKRVSTGNGGSILQCESWPYEGQLAFKDPSDAVAAAKYFDEHAPDYYVNITVAKRGDPTWRSGFASRSTRDAEAERLPYCVMDADRVRTTVVRLARAIMRSGIKFEVMLPVLTATMPFASLLAQELYLLGMDLRIHPYDPQANRVIGQMTMLRKSLFPGGGLVGEHSQAILGPQISGSDAELARLLDVGHFDTTFLERYTAASVKARHSVPMLVVDTVFDSGKTLKDIANRFTFPAVLSHCVLIHKGLCKDFIPGFVGMTLAKEQSHDFLHGFGMDKADGTGRGSPNIFAEPNTPVTRSRDGK